MIPKSAIPAALVLLGSLALLGGEARASSQDHDAGVRLNLLAPGARSLGMGGAFLALADDATAAYTNPAGLTNLTIGGSEVAVEFRGWEFNTVYGDRGHVGQSGDDTPTLLGVDTLAGYRLGEATSTAAGLSFLSFAYVLPRGVTLAFYRHELANYNTEFETQGAFVDIFQDIPNCQAPDCDPTSPDLYRYFPRRSRSGVEIVNYGVSGAFAINNISVGLGVSYYELDLLISDKYFTFNRFLPADNRGPDERRQPGEFYGLPDFSDDNLINTLDQSSNDGDFGINAGFLWKLGKNQRWSIGGVFRQGPRFKTKVVERLFCGREFPCFFDRTRDVTEFFFSPDDPRFGTNRSGVLTVPDIFGLGVAYRSARDTTRVTLDVEQVRYSQRLPDHNKVFELFGDSVFHGKVEDYRIPDADQIHLGFEQVFFTVESLFVGTFRAGVWNEPYHDLQYVGTDRPVATSIVNRPEDDETHLAAGVGLVIKEDYQIDLAVDISNPATTVSFSLVKFF